MGLSSTWISYLSNVHERTSTQIRERKLTALHCIALGWVKGSRPDNLEGVLECLWALYALNASHIETTNSQLPM